MKAPLALAGLVALSLPLMAAQPVRVLILTGQSDYPFHDWRASTPFVENLLTRAGGFDVRVLEEPRGLTRETLAPYDAVILNYNGPRWGSESEAALEEFVRSGKGMVSFHGVSYGPLMGTLMRPGGGWDRVPGWAAYSKLLGVSWDPDKIGHAARHAFTLKLTGGHPITDGMEAEFKVNDELYHRMNLSPDAHVLATAFSDPARKGTGNQEPLAWTVAYGKGRTFHTPLGHDVNALYQPEVMTLLVRATQWAATGTVTLPARINLESAAKDATRVLLVTGGHSYDPSFYGVFESQPGIRWSHVATQKEAFTAGMKDKWDVVVLYDMYNTIGEPEQKNLRAYVEAGKGVVALHHSIVDYTSWPWWYEEVIGGKYFEKAEGAHPASHYKDDVPLLLRPAKGMENHPIVRGLGELVTVDECYRSMWHSPQIRVLMETVNEFNDLPVVYLGPNPNFRTVYIQLGHGSFTHAHPGYRKLVGNAIAWAAGKAN